jgi:hypothetical protein
MAGVALVPHVPDLKPPENRDPLFIAVLKLGFLVVGPGAAV